MKKIVSEVTMIQPVPVRAGQKSNFGEKRAYEIHPGTDIGARVGTPVLAPMDGEIELSHTNIPKCGATIDIDYKNGFWSRFCHMSRIDVKKGDIVKQGQVVGLSGGEPGTWGAGNSKSPHLHFTLKLDGKNVDPLNYINKTVSQGEFDSEKLDNVVADLDGNEEKPSFTKDYISKKFPTGVLNLSKMFNPLQEEVQRIKNLMK